MAEIRNLDMAAAPQPRDVWLNESMARGGGTFVGRITPGGERRFYFRYAGTAGQVRLLIGSYHVRGDGAATFTVAQARAKARELSALYRGGIRDLREHLAAEAQAKALAANLELDRLNAERRAATARAEAEAAAAARRKSVRQLFADWQLVALTARTDPSGHRIGRKDNGESVRHLFEVRVFPVIGDLAAEDVGRGQLLEILDRARSDGRLRTANVLLAELRQMFGFAVKREILPANPLDGVTRDDAGGPNTMRDRALSDEELTLLAAALPSADLGTRSEAAVWLVLATAVRLGEAMGALWSDVDLDAGVWILPQTKNQRPHTIHLSDFAREQFEWLALTAETDEQGDPLPWVFPDAYRTGPMSVATFGKRLAERQRAGEPWKGRTPKIAALTLPGGRWTAHDLRRTAATVMARLGIDGDTIDECLNHKIESRVRRIYVRDRRAEQQARAFDALGGKLAALTGRHADAHNVVSLDSVREAA